MIVVEAEGVEQRAARGKTPAGRYAAIVRPRALAPVAPAPFVGWAVAVTRPSAPVAVATRRTAAVRDTDTVPVVAHVPCGAPPRVASSTTPIATAALHAAAIWDAAAGPGFADETGGAGVAAARAVAGCPDLDLASVGWVSVTVVPAPGARHDGATLVHACRHGVIERAWIHDERARAPAPVGETLGPALAAGVDAAPFDAWDHQGVGVVAVLADREPVAVSVRAASHADPSRADVARVLADDVAARITRDAGTGHTFGPVGAVRGAAVVGIRPSIAGSTIAISRDDRASGTCQRGAPRQCDHDEQDPLARAADHPLVSMPQRCRMWMWWMRRGADQSAAGQMTSSQAPTESSHWPSPS
jgi:hypothetical protein